VREGRAGPGRVRAATLGFLHGLGATPTVWDGVVARLPEHLPIWTLGLPWDATQGPAWALGSEPWVWLDRALELAPVRPDVLVGHSFGANVLLAQLAARGVGDLRGLVLLSPFYRAAPDAFTWPVISHYLNDFTDLLAAGIVARSATAPSARILALMAERIRDRIGPYGWMRFFDLFTATPMLDLDAVTVPCLVVGGERDTAAGPEDARALAERLGRATTAILPGCGHFAMFDDPRQLSVLLGDFLRREGLD
jgi:pimeloyl-ACP methyl ester carboxylesterase